MTVSVRDAEAISASCLRIGSPGFMAPEQVRGERITPACDVFCLGSVLAYAATGTLPFGSADSGVHALMFRIAEEEPDLTGLPEGIADLVRACLRKDPADRPSLEWILEHTGAEDTVAEGRSRDPWLPSTLVAQLGRHAVRLLETEDPEGAAPEHTGPRGEGPSPDHVSTLVAGIPPVPGGGTAAPAHPAYGYPQQHPQPAPSPYGYPQPPAQQPQPQQQPVPYNPYAAGGPGATSPHPPYAPYEDDPQEPPRRSRRSTALLVAIAAVVALAAGGSVYAVMNGGETDTEARPGPTPSTTATGTGAATPTGSEEPTTPSPSPSEAAGAIPQTYLGTWTTTIDNASGTNTRQLTLAQGEVGDTVLRLVADGDSYHCEFKAELVQVPAGKGPLEIGPSTVTTGEPLSSCSPGAATEVTLLSDGRLQRLNPTTGEKLTYTRR
ncbi:Protein kinase domain-containing protein OS=Streptomyces aurantiogriseus OX=66870 GN=GCM10010251_00420 PE=4 SV=1 [Streptomyces aurantiogriseus]